MDFNQLQSFIAVARDGSFTKAAERIYMSQSTISSHIQRLEDELGTPLFIRTTKSIQITPAGRELYKKAVSILSLRDQMLQYAGHEDENTLRIGASTVPSAYILPKILPAYSKKDPQMHFVIHQGDSGSIIEGMRNNLYDLAVIGTDYKDPEYECIPIYRDHMILITPVTEEFERLLEQGISPASILLGHRVIARENGSGSRKSAERYLSDLGLDESQLDIAARIDDQEAIKNLVCEGFGISIISDLAIKGPENQGRFLKFDISDHVAERTLYLLYRRGYESLGKMNRLITFFQKNADKLI